MNIHVSLLADPESNVIFAPTRSSRRSLVDLIAFSVRENMAIRFATL